MVKWEKYFWGLFFMLGAVFIVLSALDVGIELNLFKTFLVVFFVACIIKSIINFNVWGIIIPIAFLGKIFDEQLGLTRVSFWQMLGAAVFLCIGLTLIFGKVTSFPKKRNEKIAPSDSFDGDDVYIHNTFASGIKYITSKNLRYAKIESSFGGLKVRFDNTVIAQSGAVIELEASFSGIEMFIPKEWKLENKVSCSFGSVEEKNSSTPFSESPAVTLTGSAAFSGVTIFYI